MSALGNLPQVNNGFTPTPTPTPNPNPNPNLTAGSTFGLSRVSRPPPIGRDADSEFSRAFGSLDSLARDASAAARNRLPFSSAASFASRAAICSAVSEAGSGAFGSGAFLPPALIPASAPADAFLVMRFRWKSDKSPRLVTSSAASASSRALSSANHLASASSFARYDAVTNFSLSAYRWSSFCRSFSRRRSYTTASSRARSRCFAMSVSTYRDLRSTRSASAAASFARRDASFDSTCASYSNSVGSSASAAACISAA